MLCAEHVEKLVLRGLVLRHLEEVLEQRILSDRFGPTLPADELEFGDALIGLQVKVPVGVSSTQRDVFNDFARSKNMRKAQEYPQRVNDHIYLSCQLLN